MNRVALEIGSRAIVSGGTAVDFYAANASGTSEGYPAKWRPSGDVDVVVLSAEGALPGAERLQDALGRRLGITPLFPGAPRAMRIDRFAYGLDVFGSELERDPKGERVVTVLIDDVHPVHVRGPEDTILAYGESGWDTRFTRDWERALAAFAAMKDRLDLSWMYAEADRRKQRRVVDAVVAMRPSPWRQRMAQRRTMTE
ncbi:MAG TPA: hypothetical protein VM370_06080 [Candidatus Thermoplasmatota archaeon]|nr:hypothetical protein [Candidatus Thermoplasmatota archaeon]